MGLTAAERTALDGFLKSKRGVRTLIASSVRALGDYFDAKDVCPPCATCEPQHFDLASSTLVQLTTVCPVLRRRVGRRVRPRACVWRFPPLFVMWVDVLGRMDVLCFSDR